MSSQRRAACCAVAACALASCSHPQRTAADLVITHANVWTGDPAQPDAKGLAIIGDRIVDVGTADDIEAWRGPGTRVIDAGGRRIVPGFDDAHVHLVDGGRQLDNVDLKNADTPGEFARRIAARAKTTPAGDWILGGDWDDQRWTPARLPTKELIDADTPSTPVFVNRYDGHMALANSAALKLAGVTSKTADPAGGAIVRDEHGNPTGVLKDAAMNYVDRVIPRLTGEQRMRAVRRALGYAASVGVTSLQDMNPAYDDIAVYSDLANRGELTARIYAAPIETGWQDLAKIGIRRSFGSAWPSISHPFWPVYPSAHQPSPIDMCGVPLTAAFMPLVPLASSGLRGLFSQTSQPCTRKCATCRS